MSLLQIQQGISSARSDDTKSMKGAVLDWIVPRHVPLNPPIARNVKTNCGYQHFVTGGLLCPAGLNWHDPEYEDSVNICYTKGLTHFTFRVHEKLANGTMAVVGDQWPLLVYKNQEYDEENPWSGLFQSRILICVCFLSDILFYNCLTCRPRPLNTYSLRQALLKTTPKPHGPEMHEYMA